MADKVEELITEKMVKKATFLIHKLANSRGVDYLDIQKKCKKQFGYTNLAKMALVDGHSMITKLIKLTGGEETPELPISPDNEFENKGGWVKEKPKDEGPKREETKEGKAIEKEEDLVTSTMRKAIRAAVDITNNEIVAKEIPVMGLGGVVLEIGKVIFNAKIAEEAKEDEQ